MTDVYAEISQSNYDIANDKLELDEINNLLPADFTLIEERIGDNSAIYYSPKRHEIVLSFKGTTPTKLVDIQEDIIDVGGSLAQPSGQDGRYMEEVAKDYNKIQSKEGRNQLKKSLSSSGLSSPSASIIIILSKFSFSLIYFNPAAIHRW